MPGLATPRRVTQPVRGARRPGPGKRQARRAAWPAWPAASPCWARRGFGAARRVRPRSVARSIEVPEGPGGRARVDGWVGSRRHHHLESSHQLLPPRKKRDTRDCSGAPSPRRVIKDGQWSLQRPRLASRCEIHSTFWEVASNGVVKLTVIFFLVEERRLSERLRPTRYGFFFPFSSQKVWIFPEGSK
jgi:hypothetical protein